MFKKISIFFFFYFASVGVYVIYLPKILQHIGYSTSQIGIILSSAPLIRFALPFVFNKFLTLNIKIFYISIICIILTGLLFYISIYNFYAFLLTNLLYGICMGIILPFIESYCIGKLQAKSYGKARLFGSIGFIFSSLFLAKFELLTGLDLLFVSLSLSGIFAFFIVNKNVDFKAKKVSTSFSLLTFKRFWISLVLLQVSFGAFYSFFSIYETQNGFSANTISLLWTFGVLCEVLFFYFQSPLFKYFSLINLVKFSCFITAIRWLILYLFPQNLFFSYLSQSLHAISFALLHTSAFMFLQQNYQNKQLASQYYYGISYGLGGFLGSIISGFSYGEHVFLLSSFIALVAFFTCKH